ncbi:molybdopterin guanine dinucleotide-containing S/N-oxide reductase [Marinobacterium rhizophilum]|uniref:Molybdopterin guanine dinucleotide-containing S/N-oxide reductase n=1 Tax=Marinobacterium rhizophilum TaxID=420402 RepID=A0ABY5HGB6_9GAMM|nr:molybdopterin guanine dinucleotide-containing S/N-oxide reductase [Marinobacterium rhizophilum]UTW11169.1 molybdopterin guanine dinucleotide-containing S/N-oxide reductase [Marinobacterium rhizophilum]
MKKHVTSSHWGAGVAEVQDGRLVGVGAHPIDPHPSSINDNFVSSIYGSSRILRPAVRKGYLEHGPGQQTDRRGKEPFVEVSWETALDLAAAALKNTCEEHGNEAIFGGSYGWGSAGRFHHAQSQLKRFLGCAGGFVRSDGNYSYNAALILLPYLIGDFENLAPTGTRWSTIAKEGELVVMFGGMPLKNAQAAPGGCSRHRLRDELRACHCAGVKFVDFNPCKSDTPAEIEAEWLALVPGSDTAIMLALAHTLLVENLHDQAFLDRYTVGFDEVKAYLVGDKDGIAKTAEWASKLSDIPADRIRTLARQMAASRTFICTAAGVQRGEHGEQPLWGTITLASMLGQIGLPGSGFGIAYGSDGGIGLMNRPIRWPALPQGKNRVEPFIPVACISDMLLHPGEAYQYNGLDLTYPDIRMIWWAGGNPFHHHQDINRLIQAFQKPETVIVNELNWTATARFADIVFPVTSTLEREDIGGGKRDNCLIPMPKIIAPVGEARDEYDIFTALARRLGIEEEFTQNKTSRQWLEEMWGDVSHQAAELGVELPAFDGFLNGDIIEFADPNPDTVLFSDFRKDPEKNRLTTPSGKIELYSETIASFGYSDCPGQATWLPPTEWLKSDRAALYPIHMISGQPKTRLHSQLDQGAYSQRNKIQGREPIMIHPNDAMKRNIVDGDVVTVFNDRGSCLAGAIVTSDIREQTVYLCTGAWYDPLDSEQQGSLDKHGNPNMLTHDKRTSRLSQGTAAHSTLVNIEKYEGELPAITAYVAPVNAG